MDIFEEFIRQDNHEIASLGDQHALNCLLCNLHFKSKAKCDRHHRGCKKAYREMKRSDAIIQEASNYLRIHIASKQNYRYVHLNSNESQASGIGEFTSNCATFLGGRILGILEGGLVWYKKRTVFHILESMVVSSETDNNARALVETPSAGFMSALKDILLFIHNDDVYNNTNECIRSTDFILHIKYLICYCTTYLYLRSVPAKLNPAIFRQVLYIRQFLAFRDSFELLYYDNLIAVLLLGGCVDIDAIDPQAGMTEIYAYTRSVKYFEVEGLEGLTFKEHHVDVLYNEPSTIFSRNHDRENIPNTGLLDPVRIFVALQLYRLHMLCIERYETPNFAIMSYIRLHLEHNRNSNVVQNLTQGLLSIANERLDSKNGSGFQVEIFRDALDAASLLDGFNGNFKAWDKIVNWWLIKEASLSQNEAASGSVTENFWNALRGFRNISTDNRFSERCEAILENPKILHCLEEWLGLPDLDMRGLSWEDLDPGYEWCNEFWDVPVPPKGVETEYAIYCPKHGFWRVLQEEYHPQNEGEKSYRSKPYCWDCYSSLHPTIRDWRVYLPWEKREVLIREIIRENLRRTRPDIVNGTNIIAQTKPDSRIECSTKLDACPITSNNDGVIDMSPDSQNPSCSPDSSSDIYPSYDTTYIHQ